VYKSIVNIWGDWTTSDDIKPRVLRDVVKIWEKKYSDIQFNIKDYIIIHDSSKYRKIRAAEPDKCKYLRHSFNLNDTTSCFNFIIENNFTKKYMLISWWDRASDVVHNFKRCDYSKNCVEFFTAQGCHNPEKSMKPAVDYISNEPIEYTPLNKIPWDPVTGIEIEKQMCDPARSQIIPEKLHIRNMGTGYGFRKYIINDSRFNTYNGPAVPPEVHVRELSRNKINMDVYSVSGPSMRLIEGMGLGSAVLSTTFPQKHHDELIPNFHFVRVPFNYDNYPFDPIYGDSDKINDLHLNTIYKELADSYIETFESLKGDLDKINFISANAREYYLNNCTREKYTQHLVQMLDLNKIL